MPTTDTRKFICLESCRGICALLVAMVHLSANGFFYDLTIVRHGALGVTYFFVLSGFVMMHAYGSKIKAASTFSPFILRRFGRLYPLHIFVLLVLVFLEIAKLILVNTYGISSGSAPFEDANSLTSLAAGVTLTNGLGFFDDFTWNGPSWTISVEFWAYLVFFGVMIMRRQNLAMWLIVLVFGIALGINSYLDHPLGTIQGAGAMKCLFCFFIGTIVYRSFSQVEIPGIGAMGNEAIATLLVGLSFAGLTPMSEIVDPLIFAFAIIVLAREDGPVSRLLKQRPLVFLGTISYSIYMVHHTILTLINAIFRVAQAKLHMTLYQPIPGSSEELYLSFGPFWLMDALAVGYILTVVGIAVLTYNYVEVPARDFFNRLAKQLNAPPPATVAAV